MEDVLEIYKRPYNPAVPVVCMDEQPTQLIKETRKKIAVEPGKTERVDYEYECNRSIASDRFRIAIVTSIFKQKRPIFIKINAVLIKSRLARISHSYEILMDFDHGSCLQRHL